MITIIITWDFQITSFLLNFIHFYYILEGEKKRIFIRIYRRKQNAYKFQFYAEICLWAEAGGRFI